MIGVLRAKNFSPGFYTEFSHQGDVEHSDAKNFTSDRDVTNYVYRSRLGNGRCPSFIERVPSISSRIHVN